jgi:hypothetical protein
VVRSRSGHDRDASRHQRLDLSKIVAAIIGAAGVIIAAYVTGSFTGHSIGLGQTPHPTVTVTKTVTPGPDRNISSVHTAIGEQLGYYSIKLPPGYSVPLGATAPTQSQFLSPGTGGDLTSGNDSFYPGSNDKMVSLPDGTRPTYRACTGDTILVASVPDAQGTTFCVVEPAGIVAGISTPYVSPASPDYTILKVIVWQGAHQR